MQDESDRFKGKARRHFRRRMARNDADVRTVNGTFRLWQDCCLPACRRARACTGEPQTCFGDHMEMFSDRQLELICETLTARSRGFDWQDAKLRAARVVTRRHAIS